MRHRGINAGDFFGRVIIEHRLGLHIVNHQPFLNHVVIGIIKPIFLQGPTAESFDHLGQIRTLEVDDFDDIERVIQKSGLLDVARDAIENQHLRQRAELLDHLHPLDVLLPEFDGEFIGNKLAPAGILPENSTHLAAEIERAEDVAASGVKKAGDRADDLPLGAFTATRGTKKQHALISHIPSVVRGQGCPPAVIMAEITGSNNRGEIAKKETGADCFAPVRSSDSSNEKLSQRRRQYGRLPDG